MRYISLMVMLTICLGAFSACANVDYSYEYHFSVVGENGRISAEWGGEMHDTDESPVIGIGGKKINHQLKIIANPDNGYQVKEWRYNGEIVEGNKTNTFITGTLSYKQSPITITVEFELS